MIIRKNKKIKYWNLLHVIAYIILIIFPINIRVEIEQGIVSVFLFKFEKKIFKPSREE